MTLSFSPDLRLKVVVPLQHEDSAIPSKMLDYKPNAVVTLPIQDDTVLLNERTGNLVVLNDTSTDLWNRLTAGNSLSQAIDDAIELFGEALRPTITADFTGQVAIWRRDGWLQSSIQGEIQAGNSRTAQSSNPARLNTATALPNSRYLFTMSLLGVSLLVATDEPRAQTLVTQMFEHLATTGLVDNDNKESSIDAVLEVKRSGDLWTIQSLSLIHISEPTRPY